MMIEQTCGNCMHALKPDDGMYSDDEVCYCPLVEEFRKTTYKVGGVEPYWCDNWDWEGTVATARYELGVVR